MDPTTSHGFRVRVGDLVDDVALHHCHGRKMTSVSDGRGRFTHSCACRCRVSVDKDGRVVEIRY